MLAEVILLSFTIRISDTLRDVNGVGLMMVCLLWLMRDFFTRFTAFFGAVFRVAMEIRCSHYKSCSYSTSRQMYADVLSHTFYIQIIRIGLVGAK